MPIVDVSAAQDVSISAPAPAPSIAGSDPMLRAQAADGAAPLLVAQAPAQPAADVSIHIGDEKQAPVRPFLSLCCDLKRGKAIS